MWIAKVIMECSIFIGYSLVIYIHDWDKSVEESKNRNQSKSEETELQDTMATN